MIDPDELPPTISPLTSLHTRARVGVVVLQTTVSMGVTMVKVRDRNDVTHGALVRLGFSVGGSALFFGSSSSLSINYR